MRKRSTPSGTRRVLIMEEFSHNTWYRLYPVSLRGAMPLYSYYCNSIGLRFLFEAPLWDKNFGVADNRHFSVPTPSTWILP